MIKKLISKNLITTIIVAFFCFFCLTSCSQLIAEVPEQTSKTLGLYCFGTSVYNADGIRLEDFSNDAEGNILDTSGKVVVKANNAEPFTYASTVETQGLSDNELKQVKQGNNISTVPQEKVVTFQITPVEPINGNIIVKSGNPSVVVFACKTQKIVENNKSRETTDNFQQSVTLTPDENGNAELTVKYIGEGYTTVTVQNILGQEIASYPVKVNVLKYVEPKTEKDQEEKEESQNGSSTNAEKNTATAVSTSPSISRASTSSATNTSAVTGTTSTAPQSNNTAAVTNNTSVTTSANNYASSFAVPTTITHHHEYISTEVIAPTTTNYGYTIFTCKTCGDQQRDDYKEPIQCTHEHATRTVVPASCTVSGCTLIDCPDCGAATQSDITPATGHDWDNGEIIQAPTCTAAGSAKYTCTKCGEIRIATLPATEHKYTDKTVAPTCEQGGYVFHTCETCDSSYTEQTCNELGHDITFTVISPTATEQGYTLYECKRCGATATGDYTAPTGTTSSTQQSGNNQTGTQQQAIPAQPTQLQAHDYSAVAAVGNNWLSSNGYKIGGTKDNCVDIRYMSVNDSQAALETTMISVCQNNVNAANRLIASDPAVSDAMYQCECYQEGENVVMSCWHSFITAPDIELVFW